MIWEARLRILESVHDSLRLLAMFLAFVVLDMVRFGMPFNVKPHLFNKVGTNTNIFRLLHHIASSLGYLNVLCSLSQQRTLRIGCRLHYVEVCQVWASLIITINVDNFILRTSDNVNA
jgi:hypothetical protein